MLSLAWLGWGLVFTSVLSHRVRERENDDSEGSTSLFQVSIKRNEKFNGKREGGGRSLQARGGL